MLLGAIFLLWFAAKIMFVLLDINQVQRGKLVEPYFPWKDMMLGHFGKFPRTYKWVGLIGNLVVVGGQGVVPKKDFNCKEINASSMQAW